MLFLGKRTSKNVGGGLDEKNQVVDCPPKGPLGPGYHFYGDYCVSNSTSGKTLTIYVRYWKLLAIYCSLVDYLQPSLGSITPLLSLDTPLMVRLTAR